MNLLVARSNRAFPAKKERSIISELERLSKEESDIYKHLYKMHEYAKQCSHITEMGVRTIVSTWSWLEAKPTKLVCYDVDLPPEDRLQQVTDYAKSNSIDFVFYNKNVLYVEIEPTELLFIDTVHTYEQLTQELALHADKVSNYIILHDTELFGEIGKDVFGKDTKGLNYAVSEFLEQSSSWVIDYISNECNGLTVLKRVKGA